MISYALEELLKLLNGCCWFDKLSAFYFLTISCSSVDSIAIFPVLVYLMSCTALDWESFYYSQLVVEHSPSALL